MDKQRSHFDALIGQHPAGALGVDVAKGIESARDSFGGAAEKAYEQVDKLVGDRKIVSATPIQQVGAALVKLAKGVGTTSQARQAGRLATEESLEAQNATKELFATLGVEMPVTEDGMMTLAQAQRMRTVLRKAAGRADLTPNVTQHEIGMLADSVDRAISMAGTDEQSAGAIRLLKQVDTWYGENIKKFNDSEIKQFVAELKKTGTVPDPAKVAGMIIKANESARALQIKGLLPPDVWKRVVSQDMANILKESALTGEIDGAKLAERIESRGPVMDAVHGKTETERMMRYARNLAATQGKLTSEHISEPAFKATMQEYEEAQAGLKEFVERDPIAALAKAKTRPEEVYNILTQPGHSEQLTRAMEVLGPKSQEWRDLQKVSLQKLIFDSVHQTAQIGPVKTYVDADLEKALQQWTTREQKMLFPEGLVDHLRQFDADMKFLFPQPVDEAMAGFTAGSMQQQFFLRRWWTQGKASFGRYIVDHPGVQEWLTVGRERGKNAARNDAARMNLVRFFAAQESNGVYDEPQPDAQ